MEEECRLTLDEQLGVIREVMARKTKPGAVRSFRYFTEAMVDLAAAKSSPVPSGQTRPPAMDAARPGWRKMAVSIPTRIGILMRFPPECIRPRVGPPSPFEPGAHSLAGFRLRLRAVSSRWRAAIARHFTP